MHMRYDSLIFKVRAVQGTKKHPAGSTHPPKSNSTKKKGDLMIRDLWQNETDSVHDMRVMNTDAKYNLEKTPENCLQKVERANK